MAGETVLRHGLQVGISAGTTIVTSILDENTLASNSGTALATQRSIKTYVDNVAQGLLVKDAVRTATSTALPPCTYDNGTDGVGATLTCTTDAALQDISGVTLEVNDRLLVKNQQSTDGAQYNGVFIVTDLGADGVRPWVLTRAEDYNDSPDGEVRGGCFTFVQEGTYADGGWVLTTNGDIVIGTTELYYSQFSGAGQITAGVGLTKIGDTINVGNGTTGDRGGIYFSADDIAVAYNTTNLKLTANQVDTIQGISTTATPTFAGMTFTNVAGVDVTLTNDTDVNLKDNSTTALEIGTTDSNGSLIVVDTANGAEGVTINGYLEVLEGITFNNLDASKLTMTDATRGLASVSSSDLAGFVSGTSSQITVTANSPDDGGITLSLPQDIATTSSPSFTGLTVSGLSGTMVKSVAGVLSDAVADTDFQQVVTWGDGLAYLEGTASVDYNTTNLKITTAQLNTIQDINVDAEPQFAGLTIEKSGGATITLNSLTDVALVDNSATALEIGTTDANGSLMVFDTTNGTEGVTINGYLEVLSGITFPTLEASKLTMTNASEALASVSSSDLAGFISGTSSQITVTANSPDDGGITLSLPQDIATTSSPSFTGLTVSGLSGTMVKSVAGVLSDAVGDTDYQSVVTWGDGLAYLEGTASVDYNTTNLKITTAQLNTIQDINVDAEPQFAGLTIEKSGGADITLNSQTDIVVASASATALQIGTSGNADMLVVDTTTDAERILITVPLDVQGGLQDANVTTAIALGDASNTGLNAYFGATSMIGALNELRTDLSTLEQDTIKKTITQPAHGFSAGDVIRHTGTSWVTAKADLPSAAEALGIVESTSGDDFTVVYKGRISGLSGLTAGSVHFLSASIDGGLVDTEPAAGNVVKPMLFALSSTEGLVLNYLGTVSMITTFSATIDNGQSAAVNGVDIDTAAGVVWHYVASSANGTSVRAGSVHATWTAGGSVTFKDDSTTDIGNTSGMVLSVAFNGGNNSAELVGANDTGTNGWTVTVRRVLIGDAGPSSSSSI